MGIRSRTIFFLRKSRTFEDISEPSKCPRADTFNFFPALTAWTKIQFYIVDKLYCTALCQCSDTVQTFQTIRKRTIVCSEAVTLRTVDMLKKHLFSWIHMQG